MRRVAVISEHALFRHGTALLPAALLRAILRERAPQPSPDLARAGRQWAAVTPRQRDVLRWLAIGLDNQAIALETRTDLALLAQSAGVRPARR